MNYYEVLGIPTNASPDEVRHAYLAKAEQLRPERFAGAPGDVIAAVNQASVVIEEAGHALGDSAHRGQYDGELAQTGQIELEPPGHRSRWRRHHAEHVWAMERELGMPLTSVLGVHPPVESAESTAAAGGRKPEGLVGEVSYPSEELGLSPLYDGLEGLEKVADWLAPQEKASSTVVVPNVCGLHASEVFYVVARADLHIKFVHLTENPEGDGTVVDQDPSAGAVVRRHSTVTVQAVYSTTPPEPNRW